MPDPRRRELDVFEYLVMVSSLVRPAAISFVDSFVRRAHGSNYEPPHPGLEETLRDSHGIMLYQEDVTKVAMTLAGFCLEDAEELRRILNKKHRRLELKHYRVRFYRNVRARGALPDTIDRVWNMIMSFAGYSFCKPHSISYAQLSFKCAYLKAHYPGPFMAAVISNEGGFYPTFAYISEAKRMGLQVLHPDINLSDWAYTAFGDILRIGFMQIKGLQRSWVDRMIAERSEFEAFRSFDDFWRRTQPTLAQARVLIKAGCFDSIAQGLTRPGLLWRAHGLSTNQCAAILPNPKDYSEEQKLGHQIEILGFRLSCHPLELYSSRLRNLKHVPARDITLYVGKCIMMIGWLVSEKMIQTRKGDPMEFVTFEDTTGLYETAFFPPAFRRFYHLIGSNRAYILWGKVEDDFGASTLNVNRIEYLDMRPATAILN